MKLIHLSDLHIGKRVNEFSLIDDQKYILNEIISIVANEQADCVIIAGDVYDKPMPSAEAVALFDRFLTQLSAIGKPVIIISGNHDSAERLAFGADIMSSNGVYMSHAYSGRLDRVTLHDEFGEVNIYLLPFIKPANVRAVFDGADITNYTDAVRTAILCGEVDFSQRSVLVAHQFVTGAATSESEEISVGGLDNVDAAAFDGFDYVALGHIHSPQNIGDGHIRYCGTPLKYSFSEINQQKSVTVAELDGNGLRDVRTVPLTPLHDMRQLRGSYDELSARRNYDGTATDDYLRIILTDEQDVPDAIGRLRAIYPNIMRIEYDNARTRNGGTVGVADEAVVASPIDLFGQLYERQNGRPMDDEQRGVINAMIEKIWGTQQ